MPQNNQSESSDSAADRIAQELAPILEEFDVAWLDSGQPNIVAFLSKIPRPLRSEGLRELLHIELQRRRASDDKPQPADFVQRLKEVGLFNDGDEQIVDQVFADEAEDLKCPTIHETQQHKSRAVGRIAIPTTEPDDDLPERIGRYRVERVLGKGGFGRVYLARDEQLDRPVAVKVPHAHMVARPQDAEPYLSEARTLANLDHPNIVAVHDVGSTDEYPCYIVSKYVEGTDLAARLKQHPSNFSETAELATTVAEALHYAHKHGVVHRDIKPGNILIDCSGKAFIVDFGLALREQDVGRGPRYAGTLPYMSPEQARGEGHRVDGRSDIFSLGVVVYQMLTGRLPFRGNSQNELLEQISSEEPKPPRMIDDTIPKELERICLKALSKRSSDRYSTALDMAEELRYFLEQHHADAGGRRVKVIQTTSLDSTRAQADSDTAKADSDSQPVKVVPKGLRSFDKYDADFFLELLPGPRDRDGLPDSIRFWKTRIEESDADHTFSVGLIYGPSGCGKSSLVKAGLLPRLSLDVITIYVEATADDTETRLLYGLRKSCPKLDDTLTLIEFVSSLRRGDGLATGKKVLIVLDQFEQWLHARRDEAQSELVQALRHCDGGRVQCMVMVRDDFWMAATRFMHDMEIRLVEGHNSAAVDLFPVRHAEKVLAAFGRAFTALPDDVRDQSEQQNGFVKQAIAGLAEEGKVICVRLALFAEMMKGKSWTLASLKEVGGTKGVGVTFLEETFSASTAPPEYRYHQKAARAVLKALLPEAGEDIKGEMKSFDELLAASGYANRRQEFDDLMRILDSELRLITPTDVEGAEPTSDVGSHQIAGQKYYQLTHDYLVPSLREWLTRIQRESRKGRAELRLAERAALWNSKSENRHLPSLLEWINIRALTEKDKWSTVQRTMMRKAGRMHGLRWGVSLLIALFIGITAQQILATVQRRNLAERTQTAVSALSNTRGVLVPRAIEDLDGLPRDMVLAELKRQFNAADDNRKLRLAYGLSHYGDVRAEFLVSQVERSSADEVDNFVAAMASVPEGAVAALDAAAVAATAAANWHYKARLAMLALHLNSPALGEEVCQLRADPIQRTWFIEEAAIWHGEVALSELSETAGGIDNGDLRSGLALVIGGIPPEEISDATRQEWQTVLEDWYLHQPDAPTHSAAGWALRKWQQDLPAIAITKHPAEGCDFHLNSLGMTMLKIPAGSFARRDDDDDDAIEQTVTLTCPFLLADREITRAQFQQFIDDPKCPDVDKPDQWPGAHEDYSPTEQHPVQNVNWYDAVLFCNWLSRQEGLTVCYERTGETGEKDKDSDDVATEYYAWRLIPEANGYRLPTEAEWEYACRAGTTTEWSHGDEELMLDRYAVYGSRDQTELGGSKLPNGWGLFDVHGNLWEWCQDWYEALGSQTAVPLLAAEGTSRVLRGGSFDAYAANVRSANRDGDQPADRDSYTGFRLARTYP